MGKMKVASMPKMGKVTKPKTSGKGGLKIEGGFKEGGFKKGAGKK
jgi:hypothetical protein